jgi:hypothetical protein
MLIGTKYDKLEKKIPNNIKENEKKELLAKKLSAISDSIYLIKSLFIKF